MNVRIIFFLMLAIGLTACCPPNCTPTSITPTPPPPPPIGCVDFEDQTAGMTYQVGNVFTASGVTVTLTDFVWSNGTPTPGGFAEVETGGLAGGSGNELEVNNVNLQFNFGSSLTGLNLHFGEYGGNLNIEINGDFRNFDNFADIAGTTIGGVSVVVPTGGLGNDKGTLQLSGTINAFTIGGQELWIDNVCPNTGSQSCIDFLGYADDTVLGLTFTLNGYTFTALGTNDLFVNDIAPGVHGLQFDSSGVQVDLPGAANQVKLTAGSFTSDPLDVTALDSNGSHVSQVTIPATNSVKTVTLPGPGITMLIVKGGGNEGVIVEICIETP